MRNSINSLAFAGIVALLMSAPARAQLQFTLNPASQSYIQGQTATWTANFLNTDPTLSLTFVGIGFSLVPAGMTVDDTPYFTNFDGTSLAAGNSSSGSLFTSTAAALAPGTYDATVVVTYRVSGAGSDTDASALFTSVISASTAAPEPGTLALLSIGLSGASLLRRRKSQ